MAPGDDGPGGDRPAREIVGGGANGAGGNGSRKANGESGRRAGAATLVAVDVGVERALARATTYLAAEATGTVVLDRPPAARRRPPAPEEAAAPAAPVRVARATPVVTVVDPAELAPDDRRALGSLRARKVRRIVRHVSPWSVFKFSLLFYLCLWLILIVAGVLLWRAGQSTGVIGNVERFYAKAAGEQSFQLDGRSLFRSAAAGGMFLVLAATGFTVLVSVLFNLISDLTGGVRMSVVELETARRRVRTRKAASLGEGAAAASATQRPAGDARSRPTPAAEAAAATGAEEPRQGARSDTGGRSPARAPAAGAGSSGSGSPGRSASR